MGPAVMPEKVYLDDNGNPISAKGYLDDNGNPISGQPGLLSSALDTVKRFGKAAASDIGELGQGIAGIAAAGFSPNQMAGETARALTDRYITTGKPIVTPMDAAEMATGAPLSKMKQEFAEGKYPEIAGHTAVALGTLLLPHGVKAVRGARTARAAAELDRHIFQNYLRPDMERVAAGLGGDVPAEVVARGMADGPKPVQGSRLIKETAKTPEQHMADAVAEAGAELRKADAPQSTELPPPPFSLGEGAPPAQPAVSFPKRAEGTRLPKVQEAPATPERGRLVTTPERPANQPPVADPNQAIIDALNELAAKPEPVASPRVEPAPAGTGMSGEGAQPPAIELPEAWKPFAQAAPEPVPAAPPASPAGGVDIQAQPGMGIDESTLRTFREGRGGGGLGDARRAVGSEKAAMSLDDIASELGVDREVMQQMMRDMTDGPSRRPMAAELAEMDNDYLRQINNERGAVDPKLLATIGAAGAGAAAGGAYFDENPVGGAIAGGLTGAALANPMAAAKRVQELRMMGMLSGAAAPKSVLGNVGAHLTAAAEKGSMAPLTEMLRVPTNVKNAAAAFRAQPHTISAATGAAPVEGLGRINLPGRLMGAMDDASKQSLGRAGVTPEEAGRLLLTTENPVGAGSGLNKAFNTRVGRAIVPFQRIPINQFSEGVQALEGLLPRGDSPASIHNSGVGRALTAGTAAAGAAAGNETDDPVTLALLAALAGPRALPFAIGAGAMAGPRVLERVGVGLPDGNVRSLFDPMRPIDQPALFKFLHYLSGQQEQ